MLTPFTLAVLTTSSAASLLQHTPDEQTGFMLGFILMAGMPYLLLFVVGGGIFRARKKQREQEVERALREQQSWEAAQPTEDTGSLA